MEKTIFQESKLTLKGASMCSWWNAVAYGRQGLDNVGVVDHRGITEGKDMLMYERSIYGCHER